MPTDKCMDKDSSHTSITSKGGLKITDYYKENKESKSALTFYLDSNQCREIRLCRMVPDMIGRISP